MKTVSAPGSDPSIRLDAVSMATEVQHMSRLSVVIKMEETLKRSCQHTFVFTENKAESRIHQRNRTMTDDGLQSM